MDACSDAQDCGGSHSGNVSQLELYLHTFYTSASKSVVAAAGISCSVCLFRCCYTLSDVVRDISFYFLILRYSSVWLLGDIHDRWVLQKCFHRKDLLNYSCRVILGKT